METPEQYHREATITAALHILEKSCAVVGEKLTTAVNVLSKDDQDYVNAEVIKALKGLQLKNKA